MEGTLAPAAPTPRCPHPGRWAAVTVLAALVVGSYGLLLNDEMDQATAMHNLAHGSLAIREVPTHFYAIPQGHFGLRTPGPVPAASTLLDALAIPALLAVRLAALVAPLHLWVAAAAAALAWSLLPIRRSVLSIGGAALLFALLAVGLRGHEPDLGRFEAVVALQLTSLALLGATAAFACLALRRHLAGPAASLVGAALLAGPLLFWGSRAKYTLLAAALTATALWLAGEPASRRRNLALGLVAGMAVWANVGVGTVLCLAVGLWLLATTWAPAARPRWQLLGSAAAGLALGLAPWLLENQALLGNPFVVHYFHAEGALAQPGQSLGESLRGALYHGLGLGVWNGVLDFGANLLGAWTFGQGVEGTPLGVFALSPLLAAGAWMLARPRAWRLGPIGLAVAVLAVQVALLTNRVVRQGWGLDARLLAPVLPAVGVLAAAALGPWLSDWGRREVRQAWTGAVALAAAGFLLLAALVLSGAAPYLLQMREDLRLAELLWLAVLAFVAAFALLAGPALRLPKGAVKAVLVAVALAMPLLWTATSALAARPQPVGEGAGALLPAVQVLRDAVRPALLPPPPWPAAVVVNNQTVFDPLYGHCQADPSPCPWGNPNV